MKDAPNKLWLDRKTLQYLEALNAGDLETLAALWEQASFDRTLEQALKEVDAELAAEEERRHFVASQHPLPSPRRRSRRWIVRLAVPGLLVAAVLAVVVAMSGRREEPALEPHRINHSPREQLADGRTDFALRKVRRDLELADLPEFVWPLASETSLRRSALMRPDLLD